MAADADRFDFIVVGSSPLARLVAGLLASAHERRVCLVADSSSRFRLPRGVDLSVSTATRPETWTLLTTLLPETRKLLQRRGRSGLFSVDPVLVAETPDGIAALSHARHMAHAHGWRIEALDGEAETGRLSLRFADALVVSRARLEPALDSWLGREKVERLPLRDTVLVHGPDEASATSGGRSVHAPRMLLLDDAAIFKAVSRLPVLLQPENAVTVMTEPMRRPTQPVSWFLDRGVLLNHRTGRGISAIGLGRLDEALGRIGASLDGRQQVHRAGQAVFRVIAPRDGAPVIGPVRNSCAQLVAGLGECGLFLAPALARFFAGTASVDEAAYFTARAPDADRRRIADFRRSARSEIAESAA